MLPALSISLSDKRRAIALYFLISLHDSSVMLVCKSIGMQSYVIFTTSAMVWQFVILSDKELWRAVERVLHSSGSLQGL